MSGPAAIVLGLNVTGLATARALDAGGVQVHGVSLSPDEPGRASRRCRVIDLKHLATDADKLCHWLVSYARALGDRPVVFPTGDRLALLLADRRAQLSEVCRLWGNTLDELLAAVNKRSLYERALAAGLRIPPTLIDPSLPEAEGWCRANPGPYLVKPYYVGEAIGAFAGKNRIVRTAGDLAHFLAARDGRGDGLIVQRILRGGDGWIFDCYGLCDTQARVRTMASHRRIRQYPPDFGITCYGEIPAAPAGVGEAGLFERTEILLSKLVYHGIFGIEWLLERESGELYLLDFNARPFYTIGHLRDCGLNLPLLAYRELCDDDLIDVERTPAMRHLLWVDLLRDAGTFARLRRRGELGGMAWLRSLARCRSFALWAPGDPGPAWRGALRALARLARGHGDGT